MKNRRLTFIFTLLMMLTTQYAKANGDRIGNGGGGIFCPAGESEVYDLVEGRIRYGLDIPKLGGTYDEVIESAIKKLSTYFPSLANDLVAETLLMESRRELMPYRIERTLDADNIYVPEDCSYAQVANWDESTSRLIVSRQLWFKLKPAQQAVLMLHESAYSIFRRNNLTPEAQYSELVRKFIAQIFSTGPVTVRLSNENSANGMVHFSTNSARMPIDRSLRVDGTVRLPKDCKGKKIIFDLKSDVPLNDVSRSWNSRFLKLSIGPDQLSSGLKLIASTGGRPSPELSFSVRAEGCDGSFEGSWSIIRHPEFLFTSSPREIEFSFTFDFSGVEDHL